MPVARRQVKGRDRVGALRPTPLRHTGLAQPADEFLGALAEPCERKAVTGQVAVRRHGAAQRVRGGDDRHHRVCREGHEAERAGARARNHEADVAGTVDEHGDDGVGVRVPHFDAAAHRPERTQDERHDPVREGRVDRYPETGRLVERPHRRYRVVEQVHGAPGVRQERLAGGRQDRAATAPMEEQRARLAFEACHAFADRRLGDQERAGCASEAAVPHDGQEDSNILCLDSHKGIL